MSETNTIVTMNELVYDGPPERFVLINQPGVGAIELTADQLRTLQNLIPALLLTNLTTMEVKL